VSGWERELYVREEQEPMMMVECVGCVEMYGFRVEVVPR
jgi:hypothetical protein